MNLKALYFWTTVILLVPPSFPHFRSPRVIHLHNTVWGQPQRFSRWMRERADNCMFTTVSSRKRNWTSIGLPSWFVGRSLKATHKNEFVIEVVVSTGHVLKTGALNRTYSNRVQSQDYKWRWQLEVRGLLRSLFKRNSSSSTSITSAVTSCFITACRRDKASTILIHLNTATVRPL